MSAVFIVGGAIQLIGQNAATSLLVLSRDGRRAIPLTVSGSQEMVALDDLAAMFQLDRARGSRCADGVLQGPNGRADAAISRWRRCRAG